MADKKQKILIVDDDNNIAELISLYLTKECFDTKIVNDGEEALKAFEQYNPNLILLDLMLPGIDGYQVCRELRSTSQVPIIMLSAKGEIFDKVLGLELGADDYICKPFSPREVVARVKAVLRRTHGAAGAEMELAEEERLLLDEDGWRALAGGQDLGLTAVEFQLLKVMMQSPGRIFSRDQLMDHMYRDHRIVSERTVDSHVKKLRRKIADIWPERDIIRSVYGVGYKYQPEE